MRSRAPWSARLSPSRGYPSAALHQGSQLASVRSGHITYDIMPCHVITVIMSARNKVVKWLHLSAAAARGQHVSPVSGQWSRPGTQHTATGPNLSAPNMEMLSKIYSHYYTFLTVNSRNMSFVGIFLCHKSRRVTRPAVPCLARTRSLWCGRCWSCTCRGWRGSSRGSCRRSTRAPQHIPSAGP